MLITVLLFAGLGRAIAFQVLSGSTMLNSTQIILWHYAQVPNPCKSTTTTDRVAAGASISTLQSSLRWH